MANIPGDNDALPGVSTDVITQSRGFSIPGGTRIAALIGEGSTDQTLVSTANGNGEDGFDPTYSSSTGADGRHFVIVGAPLISNRTTLFKNGVPLVGLESLIDSNPFNNKYDYRLDIDTGKIELQRAHLVDQGGKNYSTLSTNVGQGVLNSLSLEDSNAPSETWTVRCVSVQRDMSNLPISSTAKFLAIGSVSGAKLDANGNPIIWVADGYTATNGILEFAIAETNVSFPFREGDAFTVKVDSGVLGRSDSLTANFIPSSVLNDPILLDGPEVAFGRHGAPSLDNNLSLGCQLAFSNASPAVLGVQAAPPMPRRTSYILSESVHSTSTNDDDFIFPLPLGVVPNFDTNIHFFITNNTTNVESQILPNKFEFYTLDTSGQPTTNQFITDNTSAPAGYSFFYTVKEGSSVVSSGVDGYIGRDTSTNTKGVFSGSVTFQADAVGKTLKIIDSVNSSNIGSYNVTSVVDGDLYVTKTGFTDLTSGTSVAFQLIDVATGLPVATGSGTDGVLTAGVGTFTATLSSTAVDFTTLLPLTRRLQINGSTTGNNGLYDVTSYNSGTDTLTIRKAVVNESGMRYELVDSGDTSNFIVINKNVVPNGYQLRISLIDDRDADFYDAGWLSALEALEAEECDILVPLPKQTISVIFQNCLQHCKSMSNIRNKKERVLFIGGIRGLTPDNVTGKTPAAVEDIGILEGIQGDSVTEVLASNIEDLADYSVKTAYGNTYRCVYFFPDEIIVQAGAENVLVDGMYLGAAAAGYLAADVKIQNPLTNKTLSGFTISRSKKYRNRLLREMRDAGVCVLQPVAGGGRVVHGITTSQSGFTEEKEVSIVFIRDRVAKILRASFDQGFIGEAEDDNTLTALYTRASIVLGGLVSQKLITAYKDLVVFRDTVDPTQWNIGVKVQPTYPINFIYIKVNIGQI